MSIEEVIDRAVQLRQTIDIEYCTRSGKIFTCKITDIIYSNVGFATMVAAFVAFTIFAVNTKGDTISNE